MEESAALHPGQTRPPDAASPLLPEGAEPDPAPLSEEEEEEEGLAGIRIERGADDLPPSYSLAEGLDQLPAYSQVRVKRARLGPYILIYDLAAANFRTFRK